MEPKSDMAHSITENTVIVNVFNLSLAMISAITHLFFVTCENLWHRGILGRYYLYSSQEQVSAH